MTITSIWYFPQAPTFVNRPKNILLSTFDCFALQSSSMGYICIYQVRQGLFAYITVIVDHSSLCSLIYQRIQVDEGSINAQSSSANNLMPATSDSHSSTPMEQEENNNQFQNYASEPIESEEVKIEHEENLIETQQENQGLVYQPYSSYEHTLEPTNSREIPVSSMNSKHQYKLLSSFNFLKKTFPNISIHQVLKELQHLATTTQRHKSTQSQDKMDRKLNQLQQVARCFTKYGPSIKIVRNQAKIDMKQQLYNSLLKATVLSGIRKLETIMYHKNLCFSSFTIIEKHMMSSSLVRCRQWMSWTQLNTYHQLIESACHLKPISNIFAPSIQNLYLVIAKERNRLKSLNILHMHSPTQHLEQQRVSQIKKQETNQKNLSSIISQLEWSKDSDN